MPQKPNAREIEKTRQGFAAERDTILAAGRAKAEEERKALLAEAQAEAAKVRKEAEAELARAARRPRPSADAASAEELAVAIARRLLGRLPDAAAAKLFIDGLCERIRGLPEQSRRVLASAGADRDRDRRAARRGRDKIKFVPGTRRDSAVRAGARFHDRSGGDRRNRTSRPAI